MAEIKIICPGKIKEKWLLQGIEEYILRLSRYCEVNVCQVSDVPDSWPQEKALKLEAANILAKVNANDFCVSLDLKGKQYDSLSYAEKFDEWMVAGGSRIVFIIGGSNGLSSEILQRSQQRLCLSNMTYTHQMTRLLLLEQCYRAYRILRNEPYHK